MKIIIGILAVSAVLVGCTVAQIKSQHVAQTITGEDEYILSIFYGGLNGSKKSAEAGLDYAARERSCSRMNYVIEKEWTTEVHGLGLTTKTLHWEIRCIEMQK